MKLLIVGATGLVGSHVLKIALEDPRITSIVAPVRSALPPSPKLHAPIVNYENLPEDSNLWKADAVICTLGTTIKVAGSKERFARVDRDYPLMVASLAQKAGTPAFILNSAMGADKSSPIFYNQVKGEVEEKLSAMGFKSLTFVRPGLIGGDRKEFRLGEEVFKVVLKGLHPILPQRFKINPASHIAAKMIEAAIASEPGLHVISSEELI